MTSWRAAWGGPVVLLALGTVPVIAGALRLVELSGGPGAIPANPRFGASPVPVVVHIVSATVFALLGALQFLGVAWGINLAVAEWAIRRPARRRRTRRRPAPLAGPQRAGALS